MSSRVLIRTTVRRHAPKDDRVRDARQRPHSLRRDRNRSDAAPLFTVNVEDILADLGGGT